MRMESIKEAHFKLKRNEKLRELANNLGLQVENGEIALEQALKEVHFSLRNQPALQAQLNRQ